MAAAVLISDFEYYSTKSQTSERSDVVAAPCQIYTAITSLFAAAGSPLSGEIGTVMFQWKSCHRLNHKQGLSG